MSNLLFLSLLFIQHFLFVKSNAPPPPPLAPALYTFGDCQVDIGINPDLNISSSKVNYYPYGIDFVIGATGRFTNGATVVDLIGDILGLPVSIHYSPEKKSANTLSKGYNYASGPSGILPETGTASRPSWSMNEQIAIFNMTVQNNLPKHFKCKAELDDYLSKSLFVVDIGTSDYEYNYLQPNYYNTSKRYNPEQFGNLLANQFGKQLKELYNLGARKFLVFEIAPIGCYPQAVKRYKPTTKCAEDINNLVLIFNRKLEHKVRTLRSRCKDAHITIAKTYSFILDMLKRPSTYGFEETTQPCCLVRNDTIGICAPNKNPCSNRNKALFWDDNHLTEAAYRLMADKCFSGSDICTPNINKTLSSAEPCMKPSLVHMFFLVLLYGVSCFHKTFGFCW
ncbi:GDSL esterase/lipase [Morus notabilis]|uniref:GDSL esterase/lipase n=1 Tax=Morus notabilis TaxID=981085 RepID=W9RA02_9ROSA|nr:GDSL esterase/lipase [Morus notabilis]